MFECENCGKEFKYKKNYEYHTSHNVCKINKKYQCGLCDFTFKNKRNIKEHLIKKHKIDKKCIDNHIIINSDYINKIKCTICGKKFLNVSNLNRHILENCGVKKSEITNNTTNNMNSGPNNGTTNSTNVSGNSNTVNYNINNNTNNYQVNMNLNNFGQEKVNQNKLVELIKKTNTFNIGELFARYVIMKHIHIPENRNVLVKHRYGGQLFIFKGYWCKAEKDDTFHEIKNATIDDISDCLDNNTSLKNPVILGELDKLEYINEKKFHKKVNDILYKNREIIGETYNKQ